MNRSYWEEVLYGTGYDLIVIGAGITGQSAAYFYKKQHPGARVLILERGVFPIGASTRNAGFACIGTVGEYLADLNIETEAAVKRRVLARYKGLQLLRETVGDEFVDFEESGGWEIYTKKENFERNLPGIGQFNAWAKELFEVETVFSAGEYNGYPAIFNKVDGMLHPGKLIQRLSDLNRNLGVEFRWSSNVQKPDFEEGRVRLGSGEMFSGRRIIAATNAFSKELDIEKGVIPGRGYVFVSKPLPRSGWKGTFHFNEGFVYFRNLGPNRVLLGGGRNEDIEMEQTTEFGINEKVKEYLVQFADEVLRLPKGWEIEYEWSGIMGFTATKTPYLKRVGSTGILAAGLSGMGVALGMQLGKDAAELAGK